MIAVETERTRGVIIRAECTCGAEIVAVPDIGFLASRGGLALALGKCVCQCGRSLTLGELSDGEAAIAIGEGEDEGQP